ncbi:reverse transcriptase domain-containing protein [Tanacetum coccineum]
MDVRISSWKTSYKILKLAKTARETECEERNHRASGTKKNSEVTSNETNSANLFDALNMIDNDDELGSNGGRQIQGERFVNTVYGFFLGKRVAYPVVANYVRNTWGKHGLVKSMHNSSTGLFFLQFNSMDGSDSMLENGTDDEDAHEHVQRVLEIADLFHFPGVTHDAVMLRVFPITLKGPALRWINRLSVKLVTTWDLLEKAFIKKYCPPFKTTKKLEIICNFKQEMDETLDYA